MIRQFDLSGGESFPSKVHLEPGNICGREGVNLRGLVTRCNMSKTATDINVLYWYMFQSFQTNSELSSHMLCGAVLILTDLCCAAANAEQV
jgi:hypothetical protein